MSLLARLADHNIGQVNWEPYIPTIYAKVLKSFHLPVMYKQTFGGKTKRLIRVSVFKLNMMTFQA
jgi:hypothetical protein